LPTRPRSKGLAPLACKTDKIDARVLAVLSERDLVPEIWLPDPRVRREQERARFRARPDLLGAGLVFDVSEHRRKVRPRGRVVHGAEREADEV
jgi:hypothetical protein